MMARPEIEKTRAPVDDTDAIGERRGVAQPGGKGPLRSDARA
jgi:hypothetical protein